MGVNHLGHHLLTHLLYPLLARTGTMAYQARIVNVSSEAHRLTWTGLDLDYPHFGFPEWASGYRGILVTHRLYGQSKLAQIYHAKQVARMAKEQGDQVIAVSLHPGAVATNVMRYFRLCFSKVFTDI